MTSLNIFVYFSKVLNLVYVYVAFLKFKKNDNLYLQELQYTVIRCKYQSYNYILRIEFLNCIVCKYFTITLYQLSTVYKGNYIQYHCNNLLEGILQLTIKVIIS